MVATLLVVLLVATICSAGYRYSAGRYGRPAPRAASLSLVTLAAALLILFLVFGHFTQVTHTAP